MKSDHPMAWTVIGLSFGGMAVSIGGLVMAIKEPGLESALVSLMGIFLIGFGKFIDIMESEDE
jgi:hypothetical protein